MVCREILRRVLHIFPRKHQHRSFSRLPTVSCVFLKKSFASFLRAATCGHIRVND